MTKYIRLLASLLLFVTLCSFYQPVNLELRTAAFIPQGNRYRAVYGNGSPNIQLEFSSRATRDWEGFVNIDWITKKGHSKGFSNPTRVNIATFSLGLEYPYPLTDKLAVYLGAGPAFSVIWIKDKLEFDGSTRSSETGFGALLKSGIYYSLTDCIFMDLFVDYFFQGARFKRHAQVGGVKTGIGIGFTL